MSDLAELDELAQRMAAIDAPWLAWAVHARDAELVAELLEPLTRQELYALAVALASQVPRPLTRPDDGEVDEVAVERAADLNNPRPGPLTRAERHAAIRLMVARRVPWKQIVNRFGVNHSVIARLVGQEGAA